MVTREMLERVRIGVHVPAAIIPDSGFEEERQLGVAVSRIAFVGAGAPLNCDEAAGVVPVTSIC